MQSHFFMLEHLSYITGVTILSFGLFLVADQVYASQEEKGAFRRWLLYTLVFGLMAAGCLGYSHEISPGVIIDARGAILALATISGGYAVGVGTAAIALLVRLTIGGAGMSAGLVGIVLDAAVAALVVRLWSRRARGWKGQAGLLALCGVGVGTVEALSLRWAGSPAEGAALFRAAGTDLFVTQLVCTLLLGSLMHLQQERRRSREILRLALSTSLNGFVLFGEDGRLRQWNRSIELMTGYSHAELLAMHLRDLKAHVSETEAIQWLQEIKSRGQTRFESQWRRKDGGLIDLEVTAAAAPSQLGGVFAFINDITQRKQTQTTLEQSEARFRRLVEGAPDVVYSYSSMQGGLFYSPAVQSVLGYSVEELLARPFLWAESIHPGDQPRVRAAVDHYVLGAPGFEVEYRIRNRQGNWVWLRDRSIHRSAQGGETIIDGLATDITQLKQQHEELRRVYELVPDMLCECDLEGRFTKLNPAWERVLGYRLDEMLGRPYSEFLHPDDVAAAQGEVAAQMDGHQTVAFVNRYRCWDGTYLWLEWSAHRSLEAGRIYGSARDITQRRELQAALETNRARMQSLVDNLPDPAWLKDARGVYLAVNAPWCRHFGLQREQALGRSAADFLPNSVARQWAETEQDLMARRAAQRQESSATGPDGEPRWLETWMSAVCDAQGVPQGTVGIVYDITQRKRRDEELQRLNRALRARSECNRLLARAAGPDEFLDGVCRILVDEGGYRLAWVGYAEQDETKRVKPVAQAGFDEGYLAAVNLTWADTERGRGPTGTCIRTRQPVVVRDVGSDPSFAPWREAAQQHGYTASAAFPLCDGDRTLGALMVYSAGSGGFDDREVTLLKELTDDVVFGLSALRTRATLAKRLRYERAVVAVSNLLREASEILTVMDEVLQVLLGASQMDRSYLFACRQDGEGRWHASPQNERVREGISAQLDNPLLQDFAFDTVSPTGQVLERLLARQAWGAVVAGLPETERSLLEAQGVQDILMLPLFVGKRFWGFLGFDDCTASGRFDEDDKVLLQRATELVEWHLTAEQASRALAESQRSLATLMGNLPGMAYRCRNDRQWTMEIVSEGCSELTGYTAEQLQGNTAVSYAEVIDPRDREMVWQQVQQALGRRERFQLNYRILTAAGEPKWVWEQGTGTYGAGGEVEILEGFILDVTARKEAEATLTRYQLLSDHASDIILFVRPEDGRILEANRAASLAYGRSRAELLASTVDDLRAESDRPNIRPQMERVMAAAEGLLFEAVHRRSDGTPFPVEVSARTAQVGDERLLLSVVRDITERKLAEEALRQSEQVHRDFIEKLPDGVYRSSHEGRFLEVNPAMVKILGYASKEELLAIDIKSQLYFEEADRNGDTLDGELRERSILRLRRKDGSEVWVEDHGRRVTDDRGVIVWHEGVLRDVSDRRRAELALQELNQQLEERVRERTAEALDLYHNAPCGYHSLDAEGRVLEMNATELKWLGRDRDEVVGRLRFSELMTPRDAERFAAHYVRFVERGSAGTEEWELMRKDGSVLSVLVRAMAVRDTQGRFLQRHSTVLDITERKQAEAALQRQSRLQQLLMHVASTYINLPLQKVEDTVHASLGDLAGFVEADRAYIFDYDFARQICRNTHEWCGEGIRSVIDELQAVPTSTLPEWVAVHQAGEAIVIPDVAALPVGGLREVLESQAVRSLLAAPLIQGPNTVGFVGFDWVRRTHVCSEEEQQLLRMFGHMLVSIRSRKEVEQALQEERQRLAGIIKGTNVGTWEWNLQTGAVVLNDRWAEIKGYTLAELAPVTIEKVREFVHPDDLQANQEVLSRHLRGEVDYYDFEARMRHRKGHWVWVWEYGKVMSLTPDGQPLLMQGTQQDITARKQLEATLRASEEKFRVLFESSRDAVITTDVAGRCLDCNSAAMAMFGLADKAAFFLHGIVNLSPPRQPDGRDSQEAFVVAIQESLRKGSHFIEWQHQRPDGSTFPAEISISVAEIHGQKVLHGLVRDISERKLVEAELRASEAKFRQLVEMAPLPLVLVDAEGRVSLANAQFSQVVGYTTTDVPDMATWWEHAYPDAAYRRRVRAYWESAVAQAREANGAVPAGEYQVTCKDGTVRSMLFSGSIVGEHFLAALLDITTLKQANESLRKLSQAVEFSPLMILITDHLGRVDYVNPAWERGTGYRLEEVKGQLPRALKSGVHSREFYTHLWEEITAGRVWRGEFCNRKKSGELYWESAAIAPVRNDAGDITHFVAVKEDITAHRQAEEELRHAKEAAEAANRAKSAFLANMSHEIRTPMNAIMGFAQLVLHDPSLPPRHQQQLATIARSGDHLMSIINDILEMARIESGRISLNLTPMDLHRFVGDLGQMFSLRAQSKSLLFRVERSAELPRFVVADETKLRQVIINLLGNAVKFTPRGGAILLRADATPEPDGRVRLEMEVEDTGPGIAMEDQPRLFEAFFQTATGKQTAGGTGLGLAISREFARLMGGDITVDSRPGAGTKFRFEVRVARAEAGFQGAEAVTARRVLHLLPGYEKCSVLIVDDKQENRELLEHLLAPVGFRVYTANNGVEAVALCRDRLPRLVLMDLRMPEMDGYEATRRLREAHGSAVKIIALSASAFVEDRQRSLACGADGFMAKPFREEDLMEQIRQLTGVEYIYKEAKGEASAALDAIEVELPTPEEVHRLPKALVDALREAVSVADYDRMLVLTGEIATQDAALGGRFRQLVECFDYEVLQKILQPHSPEA